MSQANIEIIGWGSTVYFGQKPKIFIFISGAYLGVTII